MHVGAASRQGRERGGEPKRAARHSAERGRKDGRKKERTTDLLYLMHASDCASSAAVARVASASLTKKRRGRVAVCLNKPISVDVEEGKRWKWRRR
jgi:hypothetical protein